MNSTTTFIFQNIIKFKIDNVKLVNRNIELQNEMNTLKNKISSTFNLKLFIDRKDKSIKMTNSLKFSENISDFFYEIWKQLVRINSLLTQIISLTNTSKQKRSLIELKTKSKNIFSLDVI